MTEKRTALAYGAHLLPQHSALLAESGISPEVAGDRGYRSVETKAELRRKGFAQRQCNVPALLIPIYNVLGQIATYQCRPDEPRINGDGKVVKYETPAGTRMVLDVPGRVCKSLGDPGRPLFITEGARKADAAVSQGLDCIALLGVWNWRGTNDQGGKAALPDWETVALNGRDAYIVFDSDVMTKPEIHSSLSRLKPFLEQRGASVRLVYLPAGQSGQKQGLDDFLAAGKTVDDVLTLASEELRSAPDERARAGKAEASRFSARFPGLVDIAEDNAGSLVFVVSDGKKLSCVREHEGQLPPPRDQLPFTLPRAAEIIAQFERDAIDARLLDDLVAYHRRASQLPTDDHAVLLAAWTAHTYLMELWQYSPILVLYAVPERGKTRTGKAITYAAYRGVHTETLNEASLFRLSENLGATLFLDVADVWRKAKEKGSEDLLLLRYEKGAKVPRVLWPDRGAFQDTRYYDVYGPTVIATNEAIGALLDTRGVTIVMPDATRDFSDAVTPERGLPLRERLLAFRARHLEASLPDVPKPAQGRLGDVLRPLVQVIHLMAPHHEPALLRLVKQLQGERLEEKAATTEGKIIQALLRVSDQVQEGRLATRCVARSVNEGLPQKLQFSERSVGRKLRSLGFAGARIGVEARGIQYDPVLVARLALKYGVAPDETPETSTTSESNGFGADVSDANDVSNEPVRCAHRPPHEPRALWRMEAATWGDAPSVCLCCAAPVRTDPYDESHGRCPPCRVDLPARERGGHLVRFALDLGETSIHDVGIETALTGTEVAPQDAP